MTFVLALTGSIGMGKSETGKMFVSMGVPVFDADFMVHELMASGGKAVNAITAVFPGVKRKTGEIDRIRLGKKVLNQPAELKKLEGILHPLVLESQGKFLTKAANRRLPLVVLDIPLLFEGSGENRCDASAVVSAPYFLQRQRVLQRPQMTEAKFHSIIHYQVPDIIKRQRSDYILPTGLGKRETRQRVTYLVKLLSRRKGKVWPRNGLPGIRSTTHPSRRAVHRRERNARNNF